MRARVPHTHVLSGEKTFIYLHERTPRVQGCLSSWRAQGGAIVWQGQQCLSARTRRSRTLQQFLPRPGLGDCVCKDVVLYVCVRVRCVRKHAKCVRVACFFGGVGMVRKSDRGGSGKTDLIRAWT